MVNSYIKEKLERGILENHRAIILPKEIDRAVWRGILWALTREVRSYPCSRSKIIWTNFTQRYWGNFTHSIPEKQYFVFK
jgi:hypothetical protein